MPRKRRSEIGRNSFASRWARKARKAESPEEREVRLAKMRENRKLSRENRKLSARGGNKRDISQESLQCNMVESEQNSTIQEDEPMYNAHVRAQQKQQASEKKSCTRKEESFLCNIDKSEQNSTSQKDKPIYNARARAQRERRAKERKALLSCLYSNFVKSKPNSTIQEDKPIYNGHVRALHKQQAIEKKSCTRKEESFLCNIVKSEQNSTSQKDNPIYNARARAQRERRARERKALVNCLYSKKKVIDESCNSDENSTLASGPGISVANEDTGSSSFNCGVKKFKTVIEQLLSQKKAVIIKKCLDINGRKPFSSAAWKWFGEIRLFIPEGDVMRQKIPYYKRLCGEEQAIICKHFVGCFFCSAIYMYDRRSTSTTTLCNHVSRYHVACNWPKECFQDSLQEASSICSASTESQEISNPSEQNITIIDACSVIKTEILDPSEEIHDFNFTGYSQFGTTMPVIKTEISDDCETNQSLQLPNIKVEPLLINNTVDEFSRTDVPSTSSISTKNFFKNKESVLDAYPGAHLLPGNEYTSLYDYPIVIPESCKNRALPKKKRLRPKIGSGKKATCNNCIRGNKIRDRNPTSSINQKTIKKNTLSVSPNCNCVQEVALRKRSCDNHLESGDKNQLCSCLADKITLTETTKLNDEFMKKFYLDYPDFGKVTFNLW